MAWRSQTARIALMFSRLTGWPPPLLLVTVIMQIGILSGPTLAISRSSLAGSRFPLNGWRARGCESFVDDQVDGFRTGVLDVRAGRIEVVVARDYLAGSADQLEQDPLAGTPLMRRQDMRHPGQFEQDRLEAIPAPRSSIRLVATKHSGPLLVAHRRRAAIGQEVDEHVLGRDLKRIEVGISEDRFTLFRRREPDRLDHLDLEWLDDCFHKLVLICKCVAFAARCAGCVP